MLYCFRVYPKNLCLVYRLCYLATRQCDTVRSDLAFLLYASSADTKRAQLTVLRTIVDNLPFESGNIRQENIHTTHRHKKSPIT